jgi:hypothetical protein
MRASSGDVPAFLGLPVSEQETEWLSKELAFKTLVIINVLKHSLGSVTCY